MRRSLRVLIAICLSIVGTAHAQDVAAEVLSRALVAEAGERVTPDHVAILHVLERRTHLPAFRGASIADVALRYCAIYRVRAPSKRQAALLALDLLGLERRAPAVVELVREWLAGRRPRDPCRGQAWHWGSHDDARGSKRIRAQCAGGTRNVFLGGAQ